MVDRRIQIGVIGVIVLLFAAAGAFFALREDEEPDAAPVAREYLDAWQDGDFEKMQGLVADPPDDFVEVHQGIVDNLHAEGTRYELTGTSVENDGQEAIASFDTTLRLTGLGEWSYEGTLHLTKRDDAWAVDWAPSSIHPKLKADQTITRTREWTQRAPITDKDGNPLVEARDAKVIGLEPRRIQDLQQVKTVLASTLGVDPATVDERLNAPGVEPDHFVEITTVDLAKYESVQSIVYPLPGTVFRDTTRRAAPQAGFAQHILGRTGEITAELLEELGSPYQVGDVVGMTGLEARFEAQLAGTPSGAIQIEDAEGEVVEDLGHIEGTAPEPVATTLDPRVQAAVEASLAGETRPAAVIAVDSKGNIRASASRPLEEYNRALSGQYPPGSTFKIVSGSALLSAGTTPDSPVDCPETANAGGREFRNFEDSSLGTVPFGLAFAKSCNTAFILATAGLPGDALVDAAQRFGFNAEYSVGLTTEGGTFPAPGNDTDKAAATIGQGEVLASPLHMATVAAAVIDGSWEPPTLLPEVPLEDPPASTQLDPAVVEALTGLMRRVVTEGTGTAAQLPGEPVAGKTGTAEFGEGDPPPTHAWFVAFRGDLAVAVLVEGGGIGGQQAAPIAAEVFSALPG
ncbi:MAG TPA: penicillin-binding transpeptidase domain-containing protein [Acidimicrobiales bacterium]|nr:penicillin-binding transpeptidase domain-containing protein [Acidimicrobiales bacterium]